jgi:hypothetical protein
MGPAHTCGARFERGNDKLYDFADGKNFVAANFASPIRHVDDRDWQLLAVYPKRSLDKSIRSIRSTDSFRHLTTHRFGPPDMCAVEILSEVLANRLTVVDGTFEWFPPATQQ